MPRASEARPPSTRPPGAASSALGGAGERSSPGQGHGADDPGVVHLSCVLGTPVLGPGGQRTGRLADVIARLSGGASAANWHPRLTGLVVNYEGEDKFAHAYQVVSFGAEGARLSTEPSELGPFERRPGEVLLGRDLRSRHLIHLERARLVRANEIELAKVGTTWQVLGVDTSSRPVLRRALPRRWRRRVQPGRVIDWSDIEPFVSHVPSAQLQIPFRKLRRLHPAKLADLVEAASHEEGEEIIRAVGADRELEADVFEELDTEHQLEFLRSRSDEEAAKLLSAMAPDDAVDLLTELDQERRLPILQRVPLGAQTKLRRLLSYNPETAGGLMNPDFVAVPATATVESALEAVRSSTTPPEAAGVVFVADAAGRLQGTALLVDLLRSPLLESISVAARPDPASLPPGADIHEVVRKMTDYNLAVAPVVDDDGRMLGQITVDDVLELLLPAGWRRQYGMAAGE
ncbi:MAG: magnesium transporter MgtE N-terminal domain-containing protein [Acidimicrobiales bacterium]